MVSNNPRRATDVFHELLADLKENDNESKYFINLIPFPNKNLLENKKPLDFAKKHG